MVKRGNKKGQFYLLSAIIIIAILMSFSAISTYTRQTTVTRVYDLGEEIGIESGYVLEYGTFNPDEVSVDEIVEDFAFKYSQYAKETSDLYFVYGDPSSGEMKLAHPRATSVTSTTGDSGTTTIDTETVIDSVEIEDNRVYFGGGIHLDLPPGRSYWVGFRVSGREGQNQTYTGRAGEQ